MMFTWKRRFSAQNFQKEDIPGSGKESITIEQFINKHDAVFKQNISPFTISDEINALKEISADFAKTYFNISFDLETEQSN